MKIKFTLFLLCIVVLTSLSFKNKVKKSFHNFRSGGAAAAFNIGFTGAPFDNSGSTCSNCHGGGNYNPTISLSLLNSSNVPVTTYTTGMSYTLRIAIVPVSGSPLFGFQTTSVKQSDNSNLNNWGAALPASVRNTLTTGGNARNYIEQSAVLGTGVINIPWIAPAVATGAINFYAVGNAVDGTGDPSGDNVTNPAVLSIAQAVLPITLISFTGTPIKNTVKLNWQTGVELNNAFFVIEHSADGNNFTAIATINSQGITSTGFEYIYTDVNAVTGKNYYRLVQTDLDGTKTFSGIILIKTSEREWAVYPNPVINKITLKGVADLNGSTYKIFTQTGAEVAVGLLRNNEINVHALKTGTYYVRIIEKNTNNNTWKFIKE